MECSSNATTRSKSYDMDDIISIKEEPLHFSEISTELQEPPMPHNLTYFEMVPVKNELIICDTEVDNKEEPWHLNETTDIKLELQEPPISDLEPCMNTVIIKVEDNIEMGIKEETLWHDTSSTQVSCNSISTGSQNEEKESEKDLHEPPRDILSLETPRLPTEHIYADGNSVTFLVAQKDCSLLTTICGKNASPGASTRQNICSLNYNPTCEREVEQNMGDEPLSVYKCKICEKCFTCKSYLQSHTLLHSITKLHKYENCFTQKSDLQSHTTGTPPYKCDICKKCFRVSSGLRRHAVVHSGTRPYKCDICEKSFTQKSVLKSHTFSHSGIKPYKCGICDKFFTRKSTLQRHAVVHSGTKP